MTFEKAYCQELNGNITTYAAKERFFAQEDPSYRFTFFCPDKNCNAELIGVNIYTVGKIKQKPHFRTKQNCNHSNDCSIVSELDINTKNIIKGIGISSGYGNKHNKYPDEFILNRPKKENQNKSNQIDDNDFDIEPREIKKSTTTQSNSTKPHKTSYLENVVDSYEEMSKLERENTFISMNFEQKTYHSMFKRIKYFQDGKNFIFYGEIKPIKIFGDNYSITFKDNIWEENKSYQIGMYITKDLISNYRLSRLFKDSIQKLAQSDENFKEAKCYFVGSYPEKELVESNGKSFFAYKITIKNLDHLVIKFK